MTCFKDIVVVDIDHLDVEISHIALNKIAENGNMPLSSVYASGHQIDI